MAAALGADLVFKIDPRDAGFLEHLHGMVDIDRVAVAGVCVGSERDGDGPCQVAAVGDVFGQAHYADIGDAQ
ncbi:hypothetical protein D3C71_1492840 [compost metagenome]